MKVFILLSVVAGAFAFLDCPANQHYESCGTACPLTCDNYNDPPKACVLMCNPGCHCDEGYVKTEGGECVLPENCPNRASEVCGENERFLSCGTACPLTCFNYQFPNKFCTLQCVSGCACEEGYVKTIDGRCVLPENCPSRAKEVCGENKRFTSCGTACPLTCDNYRNPPKFCTLQCVIGCECEQGYVKTSDGRCVLPENCPSRTNEVCGANQRHNDCGTACPLTCKNYRNPPKFCTKQCVIGCECEKGYVKSFDGRCVLPFNCPVNDVEPSSDVCSLPSETGLCRGYFPRYYFNKASGQCEKFVYGGCGGNENNFKTQEDCQKSCGNSGKDVCGENEQYTSCGTACPLTCDNYQNPPKVCTLQCVIGCQCAKGYVKNADGRCVLPENCPTRSVQSALDRPDCDKAPEVGVCRARIPRFYYDQQAGMCKTFIYGGCGGNRNNFKSEFDCLNKCGALASSDETICDLELRVGPCKAAFPRYYFNKQTGQCEKFIYGGCAGNLNNFGTKAKCEAECVA